MGLRVLSSAKDVLRRTRQWDRLRRLHHHGVYDSFERWRLWSQILATRPVHTARAERDVELHLMCCERDYLSAVWALKTFYHFAGVRYSLAIHVQGFAPGRVFDRLSSHFPEARLISQAEADRCVGEKLKARRLPRTAIARSGNPMMQKFADFLLLCRAERMLALDSDVLFFARPWEIVHAVERASTMAFMRDLGDCYNVTPERARELTGVDPARRLNAGIIVIDPGTVDLERCERYLQFPEVARLSGFIEQTMYALALGGAELNYLPDSYVLSLESGLSFHGVIARHYAGPSRPLLTSEGMPWLVRNGWLEQISMCGAE